MTAAITIHFKRPDLTQECVDSLLEDGWSPILVWDNSADGGDTLRELKNLYAEEARVHLVDNQTNLGFGKGMNSALAKLPGIGYAGAVLLVNNDARVCPGMRDALKAELLGSDGAVLVAPRIRQDGKEQGWLHYQPWLGLVTRHPVIGGWPYLSGCCLLVQRADNSLPLFDEDFFMYGEDVELSWRMRREGGRLVLLDDAWVVHAGSASSGQASDSYERNLMSSHWLLAAKLATNTSSIITMRALRIPTLFARACWRSWRFRSRVPLRSFFMMFR